MLGCVALLLAASSFSFDEATESLRNGDVLEAANALERAVALDRDDREAAMLLKALYVELNDTASLERVNEDYEVGAVDEKLTALARAGVAAARQAKKPLAPAASVVQWTALVKTGDETMSAPYMLAAGASMSVDCAHGKASVECAMTEVECCIQTSDGVQASCIPLEGKCEPKKRNARGTCFTTFRPDYCNLELDPSVQLQPVRCAAAPDDAAVIARVRNSAALATLKKVYGHVWPRTLPLKTPKAKVLGRIDADGDGKEDVLVEVEITGSRRDPRFQEYSLSPDPSTCSRVFVVSGGGKRIAIAGNELCSVNARQTFRGVATTKSATTPLLLMDTSVNGATGFEALTWDGVRYARALMACFGNG